MTAAPIRMMATTIAEPANRKFLRRSAARCCLRISSIRCRRSRLARRVSCLPLELLGTDISPGFAAFADPASLGVVAERADSSPYEQAGRAHRMAVKDAGVGRAGPRSTAPRPG